MVRAALAQFPNAEVPVVLLARAVKREQLADAVERAAASEAIIAHTLVDVERRRELLELARERGVPAVDLIGPLLDQIAAKLEIAPLGEPGRYMAHERSYRERMAAIEYTLAHDDGAHPEDWGRADILLVGVSRVGKTSLAMYLAVLGRKVANLPLVAELAAPRELFALERGRVIGLTIGLPQLIELREWRQSRLGVRLESSYSSVAALSEEL
ncbi:MAG: hypothetical protein RLZZ387_1309, partial [Chloroflexota bacterium]